MNYTDQCAAARSLGQRMAAAGFSLEDNPYTVLQARLANEWASGFGAAGVAKQILKHCTRRPRLARSA